MTHGEPLPLDGFMRDGAEPVTSAYEGASHLAPPQRRITSARHAAQRRAVASWLSSWEVEIVTEGDTASMPRRVALGSSTA
jgi:hypothetical protein